MVCGMLRTMLKVGTLQLAVAMVMVGVAINLLPLTIVGSVLLAVDVTLLVVDRKKAKGGKE